MRSQRLTERSNARRSPKYTKSPHPATRIRRNRCRMQYHQPTTQTLIDRKIKTSYFITLHLVLFPVFPALYTMKFITRTKRPRRVRTDKEIPSGKTSVQSPSRKRRTGATARFEVRDPDEDNSIVESYELEGNEVDYDDDIREGTNSDLVQREGIETVHVVNEQGKKYIQVMMAKPATPARKVEPQNRIPDVLPKPKKNVFGRTIQKKDSKIQSIFSLNREPNVKTGKAPKKDNQKSLVESVMVHPENNFAEYPQEICFAASTNSDFHRASTMEAPSARVSLHDTAPMGAPSISNVEKSAEGSEGQEASTYDYDASVDTMQLNSRPQAKQIQLSSDGHHSPRHEQSKEEYSSSGNLSEGELTDVSLSAFLKNETFEQTIDDVIQRAALSHDEPSDQTLQAKKSATKANGAIRATFKWLMPKVGTKDEPKETEMHEPSEPPTRNDKKGWNLRGVLARPRKTGTQTYEEYDDSEEYAGFNEHGGFEHDVASEQYSEYEQEVVPEAYYDETIISSDCDEYAPTYEADQSRQNIAVDRHQKNEARWTERFEAKRTSKAAVATKDEAFHDKHSEGEYAKKVHFNEDEINENDYDVEEFNETNFNEASYDEESSNKVNFKGENYSQDEIKEDDVEQYNSRKENITMELVTTEDAKEEVANEEDTKQERMRPKSPGEMPDKCMDVLSVINGHCINDALTNTFDFIVSPIREVAFRNNGPPTQPVEKQEVTEEEATKEVNAKEEDPINILGKGADSSATTSSSSCLNDTLTKTLDFIISPVRELAFRSKTSPSSQKFDKREIRKEKQRLKRIIQAELSTNEQKKKAMKRLSELSEMEEAAVVPSDGPEAAEQDGNFSLDRKKDELAVAVSYDATSSDDHDSSTFGTSFSSGFTDDETFMTPTLLQRHSRRFPTQAPSRPVYNGEISYEGTDAVTYQDANDKQIRRIESSKNATSPSTRGMGDFVADTISERGEEIEARANSKVTRSDPYDCANNSEMEIPYVEMVSEGDDESEAWEYTIASEASSRDKMPSIRGMESPTNAYLQIKGGTESQEDARPSNTSYDRYSVPSQPTQRKSNNIRPHSKPVKECTRKISKTSRAQSDKNAPSQNPSTEDSSKSDATLTSSKLDLKTKKGPNSPVQPTVSIEESKFVTSRATSSKQDTSNASAKDHDSPVQPTVFVEESKPVTSRATSSKQDTSNASAKDQRPPVQPAVFVEESKPVTTRATFSTQDMSSDSKEDQNAPVQPTVSVAESKSVTSGATSIKPDMSNTSEKDQKAPAKPTVSVEESESVTSGATSTKLVLDKTSKKNMDAPVQSEGAIKEHKSLPADLILRNEASSTNDVKQVVDDMSFGSDFSSAFNSFKDLDLKFGRSNRNKEQLEDNAISPKEMEVLQNHAKILGIDVNILLQARNQDYLIQ